MTLTQPYLEAILEEVSDPEIPVLSVMDMGIIRNIEIAQDGAVAITITPTYSGCPAMDAIAFDIRMKLLAAGIKKIDIKHTLSPAWTTDWMTASGRKKLLEYGIAPPALQRNRIDKLLFDAAPEVACPRCQSTDTKLLSEFGSTACKSLYQCEDCKEPFDYFKCH